MASSDGRRPRAASDESERRAVAGTDAEVVLRVRAAVSASLERSRLLRSHRPMVVAVSGGADSLCLLDAMAAVVPRAQTRLRVGHIDHQLRPASAEDAEHVGRIATSLHLAWQVQAVDVAALAAAEKRGIEEAARLGRYRALRRLAGTWNTRLVVTGHTADDTVETVLLHLLRGSGPGGLGGIRERESLPARALSDPASGDVPLTLFRPLLTVSRADTVAYCDARGIRYLTDETNSDPRFLRNRVRHHLLPVLRTYNPAVERGIARTAATSRDEDAWIAQIVGRTWRRLATPDGGAASILLSAWQRQPVAAQRRLVRRFAEQVGYWEIGFEAVERALQVGTADGPPRAELGNGLTVERRAGRLRFSGPARGHVTEANTPPADD